jgi:hypothetical protein
MANPFAVAGLTLTVACTTPRPFDKTELGRKRIELYQSQTSGPLILHSEQPATSGFEALLGDAAFLVTRSMDTDQAIQTFVADGASCTGSTCTWEYTVSEPAFACGLPSVSLVSMCIRQPVPPRTHQRHYEVALLAPMTQRPDDISARTHSQNLEAVE